MTLSFADAATIASHVLLAFSLLSFVIRLAAQRDVGTALRAVQHHGFLPCLVLLLCALFIERIYYIMARLIKPQGLDLWALHPAPEVLSGVIALSLFVAQAPLILAAHPMVGVARWRILLEALVLISIWFLIFFWGS